MIFLFLILIIIIALILYKGGDKIINRNVFIKSLNRELMTSIEKRFNLPLSFQEFTMEEEKNNLQIYKNAINQYFKEDIYRIDICEKLESKEPPDFVKILPDFQTKNLQKFQITNEGLKFRIDESMQENIVLYFPEGNIYLDLIPIFDPNTYYQGYRIFIRDNTYIELKGNYRHLWAFGIPPNCPDNDGLIIYTNSFLGF